MAQPNSAVSSIQPGSRQIDGSRSLGVAGILGTILVCLAVGHLALSTYFPSFAINAVGLALVAGILGRVLFLKKDVFAYVLIVFFCSHFRYANNQGGLFNVVAFLLGAAYLLMGPNFRETRSKDTLINTLLIVLMICNLVGLVLRNPMPAYIIVLEGASFTGILLSFFIAGHLKLTQSRLGKLLTISAVMVTYNFVVSLNQHYSIFKIETPVLGLSQELFYAATSAFGVFGSASNNGQYAMMMLAFLAPMVCATASRKKMKIKPLYYVPVIVLCGLTIVLSNMRAAALEAILIMIIYTIMFSMFYRRSFRNSRYLNLASSAALIVLITAGVWVGLQNMERDFETVQYRGLSSVESGEALNRGGVWQYGLHLLETGTWWVGYGHGTDASNLLAWGGKVAGSGQIVGGGHLHNLYLALPTLYGWTGAIAYVLLFFIVVFRLLGAVRRHNLDNIMVVTCLGFMMSLAFFLLDEVKSGNAVQYINYPMLVWIWLGLGLAAFRTLKGDLAAARADRLRPGPAAEEKPVESPPLEEEGEFGDFETPGTDAPS